MTQKKTNPADRPLTGDELLELVTSAVAAGDLARASKLAGTALASGYMHPLLLNLRAYGFEQQGRTKEALADLKEAVRISPRDVNLRNTYGETLARLGRWEEAITQFDAALGYRGDLLKARLNLASAYECTGDLPRAEDHFRRVLDAEPANALALASLANLAARRADWDIARHLAEQALAADPKQRLALTTLANAAVATGNLTDAGTIIDSALADASLPDADRTMMLTLKGDLLHAQSRFAEAFAAYGQANTLRRKLFAAQYASADQETAAGFVQWQNDYFDREPSGKWKVASASPPGPGPAVAGHVILIGFPRSGTTLLESVLAAHAGVVALDEKDLLAAANRAYLSDGKGLDRLAAADEQELAPLRADYWDRVGRLPRRRRGQGVRRQAAAGRDAARARSPALSIREDPLRRARSARRDPELLPPPVPAEPVDVRVPRSVAARRASIPPSCACRRPRARNSPNPGSRRGTRRWSTISRARCAACSNSSACRGARTSTASRKRPRTCLSGRRARRRSSRASTATASGNGATIASSSSRSCPRCVPGSRSSATRRIEQLHPSLNRMGHPSRAACGGHLG